MARIGLKLYYLRTRERKLSQQAAADALGVRQATLSNVEQGSSVPSFGLILEMSRFYDVTPTYLFDDDRGVPPLPTERWSKRNALVTVGMWVEAPPENIVTTPDGKRLCPLLEDESFFDADAAAQRRGVSEADADAEITRQLAARRARARRLERKLEDELADHPKRRPGR